MSCLGGPSYNYTWSASIAARRVICLDSELLRSLLASTGSFLLVKTSPFSCYPLGCFIRLRSSPFQSAAMSEKSDTPTYPSQGHIHGAPLTDSGAPQALGLPSDAPFPDQQPFSNKWSISFWDCCSPVDTCTELSR